MDAYDRLRILLKLERRNGTSFERAWPRATARVAADQASPEAWLEIFAWSEPAWRRAYEGAPRLTIDWLEAPAVDSNYSPRPANRVELLG